MVRKAIKDIRESPKRSIRNLVDMALAFSGGRFQKRLFSVTQTMLKNENSPYYELVEYVVNHVDTDHLVRFGVNLGYNSCTCGAKTIRKIEESQGYNVPWMLTLHLNADNRYKDRYHSIIDQGEELGIFTWQLFADPHPELALSLAADHPDSAFIMFCSHAGVSAQFLDEASDLDNLMLAIKYDEYAEELCSTCRDMNLLYSVYYVYSPEDTVQIFNDDLFYALLQLHPTFAALAPAVGCPSETRTAVSSHIRKLREEQRFPVLPWEALSDCLLVDGIISGDACVVAFDAEGYLHICDSDSKKTGFNCFEDDLEIIFRNALPRKD